MTIRHENDEENKYRFYPLYIKLSQVFKEILEEYKNNNDGFVFLEDEPKHKIINKMNVFYQNRIDSFPKSLHIFDQEYEVEKEVETIWRSRGNKNYIFMSSHEEVFIQLSDIVIGFFRVLFEFLIDIDFISIDNFVNKLEINQKQCLKSFFDIYDCSINETEYFIQYITPLSLKEKMEKIYSLIKFGF